MWAPSCPFLCSTLTIFEVWNSVKAKEFGDDEYVWGPDPELTPVGEGQAQSAKDAWVREKQAGIPLPEAMYCSPFRRAIRTCHITFGGWFLPQDVHGSANGMHPTIVEVVSSPPAMWFFLTDYIPSGPPGDTGGEHMRFKKYQEHERNRIWATLQIRIWLRRERRALDERPPRTGRGT